MTHPDWENWIVGVSVVFLCTRGIIGYSEDLIGMIKRRMGRHP